MSEKEIYTHRCSLDFEIKSNDLWGDDITDTQIRKVIERQLQNCNNLRDLLSVETAGIISPDGAHSHSQKERVSVKFHFKPDPDSPGSYIGTQTEDGTGLQANIAIVEPVPKGIKMKDRHR